MPLTISALLKSKSVTLTMRNQSAPFRVTNANHAAGHVSVLHFFLKNVIQISSISLRTFTISLVGISVSQFNISAFSPLGKCIGMMLVILICLPDGSVVLAVEAFRKHPLQHKLSRTKAMKAPRVISGLTRTR